MKEIKVLDHGYVRFCASMGTDETVIESARMSTGKGFADWDHVQECETCGARRAGTSSERLLSETCVNEGDVHYWKQIQGDKKLLEYLYKSKHTSPFEQCELVVEVQAPVFVFREWHRHRTQQFSEFSARYAQMPNLHYLPPLERFQKQSTANKQGSAEAIDHDTAFLMQQEMGHDQEVVYLNYEDAIKDGLAKEVARINTPVSRYSKMRAKANLHNWFHFLNLRMRLSAQWEIQQYARAVAEIVKELWPRSYALFEEYDLNGVRLSATEAKLASSALRTPEAHESFGAQKAFVDLRKKLEGA